MQHHILATMSGPGTWIESNFCKRECIKFVPSNKDNARCCCGLLWQYHRDGSPATLRGAGGEEPQWTPSRHTHLLPTDAFGTLEFQGGPMPTKAQFVRLAHDTRPDLIIDLLTREWILDLPKLLITIQGGKTNFELQPKLKKAIRKGLWKAAKTTGAWVFTAGTNTGVTRHVGEALDSEASVRVRTSVHGASGGRMVSVGIAPWGVIEGRSDLVGRNADVQYHPRSTPRSKFAALNSHHTFFLLVDNGTSGKYGAELILRRKLENYISKQRIQARGGLVTPVVCVVIEGGPHTIRQVLEYVTDTPPVPVIVCDGTGRAADIIAFVYRCHQEGRLSKNTPDVFNHVRSLIVQTLEDEFDLRTVQAERLFEELLSCVKRKELITVFRLKEGSDELDEAILSALLHAHFLSDTERLSLALTWNRVDIARTHVFNDEVEWPQGSLELAMMDALVHDRIEFVKLLLEQGVIMTKFLTVQRLEDLYNAKQGPSNTLRYILRDVRKSVPRDYRYSLPDIGLVINKLMGGAFRSTYTRRKFRNYYNSCLKTSSVGGRWGSTPTKRLGSLYQRNNDGHHQHLSVQGGGGGNHLSASYYSNPDTVMTTLSSTTSQQQPAHNNLLGVSLDRSMHESKASAVSQSSEPPRHQLKGSSASAEASNPAASNSRGGDFEYPFSELLVWSVLTKRQGLALLMWRHGEEALAKSLVAAKLYKALACEAADDDLETEVYEELRSYAKEFETLAAELLTFCYQQDEYRAHQLLTYELRNWSKQTCLALAVAVNHRTFIAQPCCQILLADLWLGGLRTRKNTNLKVLLGLLLPPVITCLGFRSREELRTMPQTREERWEGGTESGGAALAGGAANDSSDTDSSVSDELEAVHGVTEQETGAIVPGKKSSRSASPQRNFTSTTIKVPLITHVTGSNTSTAPFHPPPSASHLHHSTPTNITTTTLIPPLSPMTVNSAPSSTTSQRPAPSLSSSVFPFIPPHTDPQTVFEGGSTTVENGCHGNHVSVAKGYDDTRGGSGRNNRRSSAAVGSLRRRDALVADQSALLFDKRSKELSSKIKFYEFYNAPITKFWSHSIAYLVFLCMYTYVVLVRLPPAPHFTEYYTISYIVTLMLEKIRQVMSKEPHELKQKLEVWSENRWNVCDVVAGSVFLLGLTLRLQEEPVRSTGRVIYCTIIMYWYLKSLEILSAHKYLGPLVMMIGKMLKNMAYFVVLLLVVLMAFGVCRQSILFPNEAPHWRLARHIFYQPYFMLYGEVFAGDIDPDCGGEGEIPCHPGRWITPTAMSIYLLVANILLINLLIAVFNNIFTSINAMSQQVWKFQRFQVVMEFEERPVFPPPLIFLSHIHRSVKYIRRRWKRRPSPHDKGLKLFLDSDSLERIHDYEEECVYGYIREKEQKELMTTDERVRTLVERSDTLAQKMEDVNSKLTSALTALNTAELRYKRMEESNQQLQRVILNLVREEEEEDEESGDETCSSSSSGQEIWSAGGDQKKVTCHDTPKKEEGMKAEEVEERKQEEEEEGKSEGEGVVKTNTEQFRAKTKEEERVAAEARKVRRQQAKHFSDSSELILRRSKRLTSSFKRKTSEDHRRHGGGGMVTSPSSSRVTFASNVHGEEDDDLQPPPAPFLLRQRRKSSSSSGCCTEHHNHHRHHKAQRSVSSEDPQQHQTDCNYCRPRIRVIPPSSPPLPPIIKINSEYTSLADELESVVMASLTPPALATVRLAGGGGRIRHHSEGGAGAAAAATASLAAANPLRDAEEADYLIMENVIQRRLYRNSENLAVSLEELCSIHTAASAEELHQPVVVTADKQQSPTIETQQTQGSCKVTQQEKDDDRVHPPQASPEDSTIESIEVSPATLRRHSQVDDGADHGNRVLPTNLKLCSHGASNNTLLQLPAALLASPVHSLLIVDQSVVPLQHHKNPPPPSSTISTSLCPPPVPLASPTVHSTSPSTLNDVIVHTLYPAGRAPTTSTSSTVWHFRGAPRTPPPPEDATPHTDSTTREGSPSPP